MTRRLTTAVAGLPDELAVGPVAARIRQRLATRTTRARAELAAALDSDRYVGLRAGVRDLAGHGELGPARPKRLHRRVHKALRRADRRLARALATPARVVPAEPSPGVASREERLHEARKAYKRARYAVEVLAPSAGKPAGKLAKRLSALQDVLGAYQDSRVSRDLLRAYGMQAHLDGENGFTSGLVYAREEVTGARSADRVPAAHHRTGRKRIRRWLDHTPARYR
jgi:CHAD domain-containing protein